jgi:hypothetical protein
MTQVSVTFPDGRTEHVDERMLWSARLDGALVPGMEPLMPPRRDDPDLDPRYAEYLASIDIDFALMLQRERATDIDEAAELDRRLEAQRAEAHRLWDCYEASLAKV